MALTTRHTYTGLPRRQQSRLLFFWNLGLTSRSVRQMSSISPSNCVQRKQEEDEGGETSPPPGSLPGSPAAIGPLCSVSHRLGGSGLVGPVSLVPASPGPGGGWEWGKDLACEKGKGSTSASRAWLGGPGNLETTEWAAQCPWGFPALRVTSGPASPFSPFCSVRSPTSPKACLPCRGEECRLLPHRSPTHCSGWNPRG